MNPQQQAKWRVLFIGGIMFCALGVLTLFVLQVQRSLAPSNSSAAAASGNSAVCDNIFLNMNYGNFKTNYTTYMGRSPVQSTPWIGALPTHAGFACTSSVGANPGPWRAAVFKGEIDATKLATYIAKTYTNALNFTPAVSTSPPAGSLYTVACLEVTPIGDWQTGNWTPTGIYCDPVRITSTEQAPVVGGVDCGPIDVNNDQIVSLPDLSSFATKYNHSCNSCTPAAGTFTTKQDVNGDCKIDLVDLSNFASQYTD